MVIEAAKLFEEMHQKGASDLHLNANVPPIIRVDGRLLQTEHDVLTGKMIEEICFPLLTKDQIEHLKTMLELDLSLDIKGVCRFRANFFWQLGNLSAAFRSIPYNIPEPESLGLPDAALKMADLPRGLVLVTGPTGSGKSTSLAAMIEKINRTRAEHIITVEDPVEYLYSQKKSLINQREVGADTKTFSNSLKYALRQDPDVILVGEMRDLETISHTITAAETGHLVFATLHTNTAVETIDRIIDVFPPHQQPQVRTQLAFILQGVLSQQLLPKVGGGRCLAMEILIPTSAVRNLIREGKTHQVPAQMQMGQEKTQMTTMDQALARLVKSGLVNKDDAFRRAVDQYMFNDLVK